MGDRQCFWNFAREEYSLSFFLKMLWNRGFNSSLFLGKTFWYFCWFSNQRHFFWIWFHFAARILKGSLQFRITKHDIFPKYIHRGRIFFLASEAHYFSQYNRIRNRFFPFRIQWDLQKFAFILTPKLDFPFFSRLYFPTISFPKGKKFPYFMGSIKYSVSE